jgi:cytochrome c oxidase subunit 2
MRDRKPIVATAAVLIAAFTGLTAYGVSRMPADAGNRGVASAAPAAAPETAAGAVELGRRVFREQKCFNCHLVNGVGKDIGPDLSLAGRRLQESFVRAWLKDPKSLKPGTIMPPVAVNAEQFDALVAYLRSLRGDRPAQ